MKPLKRIKWTLVLPALGALAAVFTPGEGLWYTQGFDQQYPQLTHWLTVILVTITLFINAYHTHESEGGGGGSA